MKILLVLKEEIRRRPPIQSLLADLLTLDIDVSLISLDGASFNENITHYIDEKSKSKNKLIKYYDFRQRVHKVLKNNDFDYIWFCSLDSYLPLLYSKHVTAAKVILQLQELYDRFKGRLNLIRPNAKMFKAILVPEYNRAHILKVWLDLDYVPFVLPNKPSDTILENVLNTNRIDAQQTELIKDNGKIRIIYQGHIDSDRSLLDIARICNSYHDDVELYLLGKEHNNYLSKIKQINPNVIYLGWVNPPEHLYVTREMDIGILEYKHIDLNNVFCAPNKIWEYTAFGMPVISNDLPGVSMLIEKYDIGMIYRNFEDFELKLCDLIKNFNKYRTNAEQFYKSVDRVAIINEII
ncbi:glycosyltransferase [Vibrio breoganii]